MINWKRAKQSKLIELQCLTNYLTLRSKQTINNHLQYIYTNYKMTKSQLIYFSKIGFNIQEL